jgi:hypothetical protein
MKINLYEELEKLGVLPIKYSTANLILTESSKVAAVGSLVADYKKHKLQNGCFLRKKINDQQTLDMNLNMNLNMNDFNLEDFMCSHLVSLLEAEIDAAGEEEEQTITEISQWLR